MADKICFGVYELDRDAKELRKRGALIRLQDQALRVLAILTARPGEIVTRQELQEQIWGKETFVDFDQSINKAVNRIREALNDDAGTPRYVETVPRRGYRFIAPVATRANDDGSVQPITIETSDAILPAPTPVSQPLPSPGPVAVATSSKIKWRVAVVTIASILSASLIYGVREMLSIPQPRILKSTQLTNDGMVKGSRVATDGSQIYFTESDPDTHLDNIQHIPVTGGEPTAISVPTLKTLLGIQDISPEHDRLLVWAGHTSMEASLWSVPLAASSPRPLSELHVGVGFNGIRWSPDGQELVYADGSNLYLAQGDGSEPRKLLTVPGLVSRPVWSPDGKFIRFLAPEPTRKEVDSLFEVPAAGGEPRKVTPGWQSTSSVCFGNWTPDARYFLFLTDCDGRTTLWAIPESHGFLSLRKREPVLLTSGPMRLGSFAFSLDGKKIFIQGYQLRGEVERYDRKSAQFVPLRPALSADSCVYSNDGQWMAYVTYPEASLWRSKPDGSQRQQLTWPPMTAQNPHWSPDGSEIAFSVYLPEKAAVKTFIIGVQGGRARELTQSGCSELDAGWSPDKSHIVFGGLPAVPGVSCPDGLGLQSLDLKTRQISKVPGSAGLWAPRLSPDGKSLVALNTTLHSLMIGNLETANWSELVNSPKGLGFPQWSGNGGLVYYTTSGGMYSIRVKDRKIERVAADASGIHTTGVWGYWSAVAPDGSALILGDTSMNEIYALDFDAP